LKPPNPDEKALHHFIETSIRERVLVELRLQFGLQIVGVIIGQDQYSILLRAKGTEYLIYKSSIVTVSRRKRVRRSAAASA